MNKTTINIVTNGVNRSCDFYMPPGYHNGSGAALVIGLHGGDSTSDIFALQTGLPNYAAKNNFLLALPNGTPDVAGGRFNWNAKTCCGQAAIKQVDDVQFMRDLLIAVNARFAHNPRRVHFTGISNGAMLAYRVACEASELVASIGVVAGDMSTNPVRPKWPVPIMHVHGMADKNVPYYGGIGPNALVKIHHNSIPLGIGWWCGRNNCAITPIEQTTGDYVHEFYVGPQRIEVYRLLLGGHNWPGGVDITANLNTGLLVASFSTNDFLWRFFQGLVKPEINPNP